MKLKAFLRTMFSLFLVGMLIFVSSLDFTVSSGQASETPIIRVSPSYIEVPQNTLFNVSILIENMPEDPGVAGVQFKLMWNSSILNGVNMEEVLFSSVPPGEEDNIWQLKHEFSAGQVFYAYCYLDANRAVEGGYLPKSGNGTLAIITFNSTAPGETDLHFSENIIGDMNAKSLPHDVVNGTVQSSEETVVHYVWNQIVKITNSFNDGDPGYTEYSLSGEINMTFGPPDINGVINLTVPKESLYMLPVYRPDFNHTVTFIPLTDWYGKLYTINYTGDVDLISMTNDTGMFFWKDGSWHPRGEEWIGDGIPDPAGSSWLVSIWNTTFYQGNGTDGPILSTYVDQLWLTTGFSENIVIEPASRLNGFYTNSTGVPFSSPFVGSIGTYVFAKAHLNIEWEQGNLQDLQHKTDQLMVSPPAFITSLFSPANLYVTDPDGFHVGTDPTTGLIVNEIDGAFYSGNGSHPQRIVISDPLDGVYDIKIVGTGTGSYTSVVEYATDEKTTTHSHTGDISVGQVIEGEANISEGEMTYTPQILPGDLNYDGTVDIYDAIILASAFGSEPGYPNWNPDTDINQDGIVDIYDVIILAIHFGEIM